MKGNARMVGIAVAIVISGALPLVMLGALGASIRRDLVLSNAELGVAIAVFSTVSMMIARPGGSVGERLGWRRAGTLACGLSATSFLAIAAAGHGVWTLSMGAAVGGLAQAVAAPSSNLLMTQEIPTRGTGTAMGVKQSAVPIAAVVAGSFVPLFALTLGWRFAFLTAGILTALIPLGIPRKAREGTPRSGDETAQAPAGEELAAPVTRRRPSLLAMGVAGFLGTAAAHSYNAFFVVSSVDRGIGEGTAATLFAGAGLACLVVRVLSGITADRSARLARLPLTGAGLLLAFGVGGMALLAPPVPALIVAGGLLTYSAGWGWPTLYHLAIVRYYVEAPARATGSLRIGLAGGAMAGPVAFGFLSSASSYTVAWLMVAGFGALGAIALIRSERSIRRPAVQP